MKGNDWILIGAGLAMGVAIGGLMSAAMADLFNDPASKATIYMGLVGFAGVIFTIGANGYMERTTRDAEIADRRKALGHALIFKMVEIYSNNHHIYRHISECLNKYDGEYWERIIPFVNLPDEINFSIDERTMLLSLKDTDLFNMLVNCDKAHNTKIRAFQKYLTAREDLLSRLKPDQMDGYVGAAALTHKQLMDVRPKMVELNSIIEALIETFADDLAESKIVLEKLVLTLRKQVGIQVRLEPTDLP